LLKTIVVLCIRPLITVCETCLKCQYDGTQKKSKNAAGSKMGKIRRTRGLVHPDGSFIGIKTKAARNAAAKKRETSLFI